VRVVAPVAVSTTVGPPMEVAPLSLVAAKVSTGHHGRARSISLREPKTLSDHWSLIARRYGRKRSLMACWRRTRAITVRIWV